MKLFDVSADEIERLTPFTLAEIMKKILRTELTALKLKQSGLVLSLDINDPDGGLDAFLGVNVPNEHPWLPEGKSGWQFKAVTAFSPTDAVNEVINAKKTALKPRIDKLLKDKATYALVIGGKDYVPRDIEAREKALIEIFVKMGYPDAKAKVFSSGQIADWASTLPSVVAYLKQDRDSFKDFSEWQKTISSKPFIADSERKKIIASFRETIIKSQNDNRATVIRLVGLSGVGKTRIAYEFLNVNYLREVVLYLESPDKLPQSRFNEIARNSEAKVILVIDECSHSRFVELAREAECIGGRFTLITLDYDIDNPRNVKDIHKVLSPLEQVSSEELIKTTTPSLPENARKKIVEFSEGFPMILITLAENFASHPDILSASTLNELGINEVLDRIIVGRGDGAFPVPTVRAVLTAISLFKRIGWDDDLAVQGQRVCEIQGIKWSEARTIVAEQEKRKLIARGGRYRYVTPLPLAINLSSAWLHAMDNNSLRSFYEKLNDAETQKAFLERLADLGYTAYAKEVLRGFLSTFDYKTLNTSFGSEIFLNLSKSDHSYSMDILEKVFSACSRDDLLQFRAGRRNVVWTLQRIAWWKDTFANSASLLLRLADAENEDWSNNATGTFVALFQTYLGGTEVPVWERFPLLQKALSEGDKNTQKIIIKAIGASLRLTHAFRASEAEEQGVVIPPPEWNPTVRGDIEKAVSSALSLIDTAMHLPDREIQLKAAQLVLSNSRELLNVGFFNQLLDRFSYIQATFPELEKEMITTVERIIYFDGKRMPSQMLEDIQKFRDEIIGNSYHSLMVRYVKVDVFEDHLEDRRQFVHNKIRELATIAISSPEQLEKEIPWLITNQGGQAYLFGKMLGELDSENKWLNRINDLKNTLLNASVMFLSGYLSALKARDQSLYRQVLLTWFNYKIPPERILEIIWRSGPSDWDAQFVINMLKERKIRPNEIQVLTYGAWFKHIKTEIFIDFLREFCQISDEESASAILGIIDQYVEDNPLILNEKDLIIAIMKKAYLRKDIMDDYYWNKLSTVLTEKFPEITPTFVDLALKRLAQENIATDEGLVKYLRQALIRNPKETWLKMKETLNADNLSSWRLVELIKGGFGFDRSKEGSLFSLIPQNELWQWIDEKPDKAPFLLARMIPLKETEPQLHPIARELILKFPTISEIRAALLGNWYTEGFSGKASDHYKYKLSVVQVWKKDAERVIRLWAKEEESVLKKRIKEMEIKEAEET